MQRMGSLFVDVDHAESARFVVFPFVLHGEDHDLVARVAVALFFCHLQDQSDQLLHVLL